MVTINEQIKILQAYKEGKTIQILQKSQEGYWMDIPPIGSGDWQQGEANCCQFNFFQCNYRIKPGQEQEQTQQDPAKTRETGYEFIKEQITKALEPMLKPEELHREIKSYIEDRFYESCGESLNEAAFEFMMKGLKGELEGDISKIFKDELQTGIKAYLHELSPERFLINIVKDNPELNNLLTEIVKGAALSNLRSAAADAVEKYIDESDHGYDKIWEWVQYEINENEYLKERITDKVKDMAEDQITNHLSINIQLT